MKSTKKNAHNVELTQLKTAMRFLADEWERMGDDQLERGRQAKSASKAGLYLGESKAHYQAAGAVHLVINMVSSLEEENVIAPLSIVRQVVNAFSKDRT